MARMAICLEAVSEMAIKEEIMPKEDRFAQHDMKRRGSTDTAGTVSDGVDAPGPSNRQILKVYDKSIHRKNTQNKRLL